MDALVSPVSPHPQHAPTFSPSFLGTMFTTPPVIHAMAEDSLLFWGLAQIHARTRSPIMAILSAGNLAGG